jgi:hypothetical protein
VVQLAPPEPTGSSAHPPPGSPAVASEPAPTQDGGDRVLIQGSGDDIQQLRAEP